MHCQICCNPNRKTKFNSARVTICQWCITRIRDADISLSQARTHWLDSYQCDLVAELEGKVRRLARLTRIPAPQLEQSHLNREDDRALNEVKRQEGFLVGIFRSLIDDGSRRIEAFDRAEKAKQRIIEEHQARVLAYGEQQQNYVAKLDVLRARLENLPSEADAARANHEIDEMVPSASKSLFTWLLRANALGLIQSSGETVERLQNQESDQLRQSVLREDRYRCVCCERDYSIANLHVHHIIPLYRGGTNDPRNLVTVCYSCHKKIHKREGIEVTKPEIVKHAPRRQIFCAVDIETTGLHRNDKIIEIAAVRFIDGKSTEHFQTFVDINQPLPTIITKITGITDSMLRGCPSIQDAMAAYHRFVGSNTLVFHNASFDTRFLNRDAELFGLPEMKAPHCTLRLSREKLPRLSSHKLGFLADYFAIPTRRFHRALDDAKSTGHLYVELLRLPTQKVVKKPPRKSKIARKPEENLGQIEDSSQASLEQVSIVVCCPACDQKLRVPAEKLLKISCPTCKHTFTKFTH